MSVNDHISIKTIDVALTANIDTVETDDLYLGKDTKDIHLSRVAADVLALGSGDALAVDTLYFDSANRDVALSRSAADVLKLASGDSLAVDKILLDSANQDVNLYRAAANTLKTDSLFHIKCPLSGDVGNVFKVDRYDGTRLFEIAQWDIGTVKLDPPPADATTTLQDSPLLYFTGRYWDGTASIYRLAKIFHRMLSTTPTSELVFAIAGVDYLTVGDNGIVASKDIDGNTNSVLVRVRTDVADYGGGFLNYTPPAGAEGALVLAADTNATTPGQRLYCYVNGTWRYVDLT
jgi:hypothetical protein